MTQTKHFQGPGFIMYLPTDWFISSSLQFQAIFLAPKAEDDSRANLTVAIRQLEEGADFKSFMEGMKQERQENYDQYEMLEENDYTQEGGTGFQHTYRWYNPNQDRMIVQVQAVYLVGPVLFTLTGTVAEQYAGDFVPTFIGMIDSFRVTVQEQ